MVYSRIQKFLPLYFWQPHNRIHITRGTRATEQRSGHAADDHALNLFLPKPREQVGKGRFQRIEGG